MDRFVFRVYCPSWGTQLANTALDCQLDQFVVIKREGKEEKETSILGITTVRLTWTVGVSNYK